MYIAGYFLLQLDLTPDRAAPEGHISLPDQGNMSGTSVFQATFRSYYVSAVPRIYLCACTSTAHCLCGLLIMDTAQILRTLKEVPSFFGVYPSDILPPWITRSVTLIVNTDPHTAKGTHWLAVHLQPRSYSGYFCDSCDLPALNASILTFLRRACSVWEYNTI